jgi:hypothetical protein
MDNYKILHSDENGVAVKRFADDYWVVLHGDNEQTFKTEFKAVEYAEWLRGLKKTLEAKRNGR